VRADGVECVVRATIPAKSRPQRTLEARFSTPQAWRVVGLALRLHYPGQNVRNRRLRRAAPCLPSRDGRPAPNGIPRLRLVGDRTGRRQRRPHRVPSRRPAGQPGRRGGRNGPGVPGGHHGLGHTRWATHGRPTDRNAHPHRDAAGKIAVVHNGIIETSRPCATSWRRPAWSLPATPTPRSRCTWLPRRTATVRRPVTSPLPCWRCCPGWKATSPWCSPTRTSPAPSWPPAGRHRWC